MSKVCFSQKLIFYTRTSDKTPSDGGIGGGRGALWRHFTAPSLVELLCLAVCGEKINTACCSCCALQCSEWHHLHTEAAPDADSDCIDGAEILPVIEDFKVAKLSHKAREGLCESSLMLFFRFGEPTGISSCMHIEKKVQYTKEEPCCSVVWILCLARPWRCFLNTFGSFQHGRW